MTVVNGNYPRVSYTAARRILDACARTQRPAVFLGKPGIGKSAMFRTALAEQGFKVMFIDLALAAQEDMVLSVLTDDGAGGKKLVQMPLETLDDACREKCAIVFDEIPRANKGKQSIFMLAAHDRRVGGRTLHPETVIIGLGNDAESAGNFQLNDALINRCGVYNLVPDLDDIREVLRGLGRTPTESKILNTIAACSVSRPELIRVNPPEGAQDLGLQWASPRQIENGIRVLANDLDRGGKLDETALAILGGFISMEAAAALFAILACEHKLPTAEDVIANPLVAKLPPDAESGIAAIALIQEVHAKNPNAAWRYALRFKAAESEIGTLAFSELNRLPPEKRKLPVGDAALLNQVLAEIGKGAFHVNRAR